jgi:hypothetical protein
VIDVGVWFFKDARVVQELINAWNRGVPIRMLMDVRANLVYDDIWTNTKDYATFANVSGPLQRIHPTFAIDPRLNFPPEVAQGAQSPEDRLVPHAARRRVRHVELVGRVGRQPARSEHLHRRRSGHRHAEHVLFDELQKIFERKWTNAAPNGAIETKPFRTPVLPPP